MKHSAQRGFTLIETLVVIAILALLMVLVVVNFRVSERSSAVSLSAESLAGSIREMQNYAMAQRRLNAEDGNPGTIPANGYGIQILSGGAHWLLFGNVDPSPFCESSAGDVEIRREALSSTDVWLGKIIPSTELLSVIFLPPDGRMILTTRDGESQQSQQTTVTIPICLHAKYGGCAAGQMNVVLGAEGGTVKTERP